MKRFFMGFLRLLFWGLMVAIVFGLLFVFYPAVMPDDTNTVARFNLVSPYIKGLNGIWVLAMSEETPAGTSEVNMEGTFDGSLGVGLTMKSTQKRLDPDTGKFDVVKRAVHYDAASDMLYVMKNDRWFAYSNGSLSVDTKWWASQVVPSSFSHEGSAATPAGETASVIAHTYSGSDINQLLSHLHIPFDGTIDASSSDLSAAIYMHPFLGYPMRVVIRSVSSGSPIEITHTDGSVSKILSFNLGFDVTGFDGVDTIEIPKVASDSEVVPVTSDIIVAEDPVVPKAAAVKEVPDGAIFTSDGRWALGFDTSGIFDTVMREGNSKLTITSSEVLSGQPVITIYFRDMLDAYSAAKSDAVSALLYYDGREDLTEVFVNTRLLQSFISGHTAYMYLSQYTNQSENYVNTDYVVYIELTPTQYARVVISSMVDTGLNVILTDDYAASILDRIWIMDLAGGED